ncbi:transposase family protein [Streptomyces sp. NPDC096048]|uniref:transposase family protein n=1 Tax=Streptomyces sp. NPDC096048 TaxID=3366072 RepID=UPI003829013C
MAVGGPPGRSSEITTARYNKLVEHLHAHELDAIGDLGFVGLDTVPDNPVVITGYKAARIKPLTLAKRQVNELIASVRAVCEHAFAHLKNWRILTKLRISPHHATTLLRALLVLTRTEVAPAGRSSTTTSALDQHESTLANPHQPQ